MIVGIDVGGEHLDARAFERSNYEYSRKLRELSSLEAGIQRFNVRLTDIAVKRVKVTIIFGIETTVQYWFRAIASEVWKKPRESVSWLGEE
ncbi:hypothetical protein [Enterocloster bolteae]|uniref:hypothetical protein n=1 Tax=Enterocloster bolteae TaxID=208479 RepID=UPI002A8349A5|nr:hypothetical protein [Enterocloster bolteae]